MKYGFYMRWNSFNVAKFSVLFCGIFCVHFPGPSASGETCEGTLSFLTIGECPDELFRDFHMTSFPVLRINYSFLRLADAPGRTDVIDNPVVIKPTLVLDQLLMEHEFGRAILIYDDSTGRDFFCNT